jgi:hypothetical protein
LAGAATRNMSRPKPDEPARRGRAAGTRGRVVAGSRAGAPSRAVRVIVWSYPRSHPTDSKTWRVRRGAGHGRAVRPRHPAALGHQASARAPLAAHGAPPVDGDRRCPAGRESPRDDGRRAVIWRRPAS